MDVALEMIILLERKRREPGGSLKRVQPALRHEGAYYCMKCYSLLNAQLSDKMEKVVCVTAANRLPECSTPFGTDTISRVPFSRWDSDQVCLLRPNGRKESSLHG